MKEQNRWSLSAQRHGELCVLDSDSNGLVSLEHAVPLWNQFNRFLE